MTRICVDLKDPRLSPAERLTVENLAARFHPYAQPQQPSAAVQLAVDEICGELDD